MMTNRSTAGMSSINYLLATLFLGFLTVCQSSRFASSGLLTMTLKDENDPKLSTSDEPASSSLPSSMLLQKPWFSVEDFRPNIMWSLESKGKPLPNWAPSLHSFRSTIGLKYDELTPQNIPPAFVGMDFEFSSKTTGIDMKISPSYDVGSKRTNLNVQASRGSVATFMAKIATKKNNLLQLVKGSYQVELPHPSVSAVRFTPSIDMDKGQASCLLEVVTASQNTKVALNLEYDNPTISVIHSLNSRNTIAPEISLYDARILYQWNIALDSGSIRTRVDPTSDVSVRWTDRSMNGKWITDIKVPLSGTNLSALAAKLKVRRQFNF